MNAETPVKLIAVVGGSGAGKSWLVTRLREEFGKDATSLSLDNFYRDLSHLIPSEREKTNFDHPDAIDWPLFETVVQRLRSGLAATLPRYDFVTHTRLAFSEIRQPCPLLFADGLWLLWHPHIRKLFDLSLFLDCSQSLRWQRRLARDLTERGRTTESIRRQFWNCVIPMHEAFVEAQKAWSHLAIEQPTSAANFDRLLETIRGLRIGSCWEPAEMVSSGKAQSARANSSFL